MRPTPSALAVVIHDGRTVLVRRAKPPDRGLWGFPGGRVEPGEPIAAAARRELEEETGLLATPLELMRPIEVIGGDEGLELSWHHILIPVLCRFEGGVLQAGDDALEAAWHDIGSLPDLETFSSFGVTELALEALALSRAYPP